MKSMTMSTTSIKSRLGMVMEKAPQEVGHGKAKLQLPQSVVD